MQSELPQNDVFLTREQTQLLCPESGIGEEKIQEKQKKSIISELPEDLMKVKMKMKIPSTDLLARQGHEK